MRILSVFILIIASLFFISCNNSESTTATEKKDSVTSAAQLKEETINYSSDNTTMNSYVVYNGATQDKRPAVLVVHEWWGLNDYAKRRARELAGLGYVAMAVDMFGNGQTASDPDAAMKLAGPFYQNTQLIKSRFEAALNKVKALPQVDTGNIAAIGYCYGGFIVLNAAKLGEPLKGVVSFHGNLGGVRPDKNLLKAKVLVLHGEADPIVQPQEVAQFKKQMDSIGADYTFKSYPNAKHAFTNPAADSVENKFHIGVGYNADADKESWDEMKGFLKRTFGK
ncbi:MAG TPA: dienelactone hydrolase family protein [Flavisolibacter sp.]|nr:dienelactone hydrolase family protein [Flavisolibacter sp.]